MLIDSVRELKKSFLESMLKDVAETPTAFALSVASKPMEELAIMRTIAIGASLHGKEHKVAVRVQRKELMESKLLEKLSKKAKGEIEIIFVGDIGKSAVNPLTKKIRPLAIGYSCGHFKITAGTLGAFVKPRTGAGTMILSNNHVLAHENAAKKGDAILQPGQIDGGTAADAVAKLTSFVKLSSTKINLVDCAVATVDTPIKFDVSAIKGLGKLKGVSAKKVEDLMGVAVAKLGRTTGLRKGKITAFELDNVVVRYGPSLGEIRFDNQIEITTTEARPFSMGGDSGSLIVDDNNEAVALLFAGSSSANGGLGITYANPIHAVLNALKVDLLF